MSDTQTKRLITWRVDVGLLARIDAKAKELEQSRAGFLVFAAENALDDASRGVPDVPAPAAAEIQRAVKDFGPDVAPASDPRWERQQKLNQAKYGGKR